MPNYLIKLERTKEQLASFQITAADIFGAHAAGMHVKRQVLAKEKKDTFGNPKKAEDIMVSTQLLSE